MTSHHNREPTEAASVLHRYYMDIINSIPDSVYWVDADCNLIGCNHSFLSLIGLKHQRDLKNNPYEMMKIHACWPAERVAALKLDDMGVIFSGNPRHNIEEKPIVDATNKTFYFRSNRVLMYDDKRHIVGLIVVLSDITELKTLQEQKKRELSSAAPPKEKPLKKKKLPKILVIEDNVVAQNIEHALLTALNCQVDLADTGDRAMQLFEPGKYDLALMDIGLEDTSGYVVAKHFRSKEKGTQHHVPIIALTGYDADVVKGDCEQYFMEGAITKPLTREQAEQIIQRYVHHLDVDVDGLAR